MLMKAIAHGGCTDTVRESAMKVDSGTKKNKTEIAAPGTRTRVSIAPDFSVGRSKTDRAISALKKSALAVSLSTFHL